ncbi:hypothetical protein GCM10010222_44470 [Streptomyces tanashiensis]|nr:hypothetical protein GCM10010222_44470 [Streptomyces tanashiensis]
MADVETGGVQGEHLPQAGEVAQRIVVKGTAGGATPHETKGGVGDQVAGDEVSPVGEERS